MTPVQHKRYQAIPEETAKARQQSADPADCGAASLAPMLAPDAGGSDHAESAAAGAPAGLGVALPNACQLTAPHRVAMLHRAAPMRGSPPLLTAAAWGEPLGLPTVVPWHEAQEALRSHAGLNAGVYFLSLQERDIAAKLPAHPEREVAATWLAGAVGLTVPATRMEAQVPEHVRALLPQGAAGPLMVMERVRGHHFGELRPRDVRDLSLATRRGKHLCEHLGRVMAYDYLIGNPDRFPVPGLNGINPGNVMLTGDVVWCIDNTFPTPADLLDADWMGNLHRGQDLLFSLLPGPLPAAAEAKLARFLGFFNEPTLSWDAVGPSLLAGAAAQCRMIASAQEAQLAPALSLLAEQPGGLQLARFVRNNLARFRAACGESCAATPQPATAV